MSIVSAVPGKVLSTTLQLPQAARNVVKWVVRDDKGNVVAKGQVAPAGMQVIISTVLPSTISIPNDGSKYSISASDGNTSAIEYFSIVSPDSFNMGYTQEVVYMKGRTFTDQLVLDRPAECISVQINRIDNSVALASTEICCDPVRKGDAWIYRFDASAAVVGTPPGQIDMRTSSTLGVGTIVWDFTYCDECDATQEIHPVFTITPYSSNFLTSIRATVDKARMGDVNQYLAYRMSDLCHAFMRGCDYVMQSPPVAGGWPLDMVPYSLRDYIIKASCVDILRSQFVAEGMSSFDLQGLRTQLQIDRTQYLSTLIDQMNSDLEKLPQAKNEWLAQGGPLGSAVAGGVRPIGVLGLTRGTYSPWPMFPLPIVMGGGYSFLGGGAGFGPLY